MFERCQGLRSSLGGIDVFQEIEELASGRVNKVHMQFFDLGASIHEVVDLPHNIPVLAATRDGEPPVALAMFEDVVGNHAFHVKYVDSEVSRLTAIVTTTVHFIADLGALFGLGVAAIPGLDGKPH